MHSGGWQDARATEFGAAPHLALPRGRPLLSCRPAMATVTPFAALRPDPRLASKVCELPYDVMCEEAKDMAAGNPLSFSARFKNPRSICPVVWISIQ